LIHLFAPAAPVGVNINKKFLFGFVLCLAVQFNRLFDGVPFYFGIVLGISIRSRYGKEKDGY